LRRRESSKIHSLEPPIDKRIDMLEPGHSENHGVNSDGGNLKSDALRDAGDRDVEGSLTIGVQDTAVGNGDTDRRTWFSG